MVDIIFERKISFWAKRGLQVDFLRGSSQPQTPSVSFYGVVGERPTPPPPPPNSRSECLVLGSEPSWDWLVAART